MKHSVEGAAASLRADSCYFNCLLLFVVSPLSWRFTKPRKFWPGCFYCFPALILCLPGKIGANSGLRAVYKKSLITLDSKTSKLHPTVPSLSSTHSDWQGIKANLKGRSLRNGSHKASRLSLVSEAYSNPRLLRKRPSVEPGDSPPQVTAAVFVQYQYTHARSFAVVEQRE
jgi:hypothetical protein